MNDGQPVQTVSAASVMCSLEKASTEILLHGVVLSSIVTALLSEYYSVKASEIYWKIKHNFSMSSS